MLVRKFEARSIKQAIDLVKAELGPEAIILSAKENDGGFGLMGEASVEITAAISEGKFREKKQAEQKMNSRNREAFAKSSARKQKEFIQKSVGNNDMNQEFIEQKKPMTAKVIRPATKANYADIMDDQLSDEQYSTDQYTDETTSTSIAPTYSRQTRSAAMAATIRNAANTINANSTITSATGTKTQTTAQSIPVPAANEAKEIGRLKDEINQLKGLLGQFQQMPQNFASLHPGAAQGISYDLSFAFEKLTRAGLEEDHLVEVLKKAEEILPPAQKKKRAFVEGWLIKKFLDETKISEKPFNSRYHVFVGPTGQGKTSTVVKVATHLVLHRKKKVAVLSTDSVKVGAQDQLKIYCQILNIPFGQIDSDVDWKALDEKLKDFDHILIDTAGVNLRAAGDIDLVKRGIPTGLRHTADVHFVQSIMVRDADAFDIADRFKLFNFNDVIFTRLDEAIQHGSIINFSRRYHVPVLAFGTGSSVPDCFEFATKERVVDLLFNLSSTNERGLS